MNLLFRLGLLGMGLGVFVWFIWQTGPVEVFRTFSSLGWFTPLILFPYAVVYVLDTFGWQCAIRSIVALPFATLFRVRWAGESVNNVVPSAYIGGEAVKVYLLHKRGVPLLDGTSSVVVAKTVQVMTQAVFIALGALAAWGHLPARSSARPGIVSIAILAIGGIVLIFWLQSHGLFSQLFRFLHRFRPPSARWARIEAQSRQLDDRVYQFYHQEPGRFVLSALAFFMGWLGDTVEIYMVAWLLGFPMDWTQALAIESFMSVAKAVGIFIPGALGLQESGVVLLFHIFGLPAPYAISYALIRRGRELLYALAGGLFLLREESSLAGLAEKIQATTELKS